MLVYYKVTSYVPKRLFKCNELSFASRKKENHEILFVFDQNRTKLMTTRNPSGKSDATSDTCSSSCLNTCCVNHQTTERKKYSLTWTSPMVFVIYWTFFTLCVYKYVKGILKFKIHLKNWLNAPESLHLVGKFIRIQSARIELGVSFNKTN